MNNQIKLPELMIDNSLPQDSNEQQNLEKARHEWARMAVIRLQTQEIDE